MPPEPDNRHLVEITDTVRKLATGSGPSGLVQRFVASAYRHRRRLDAQSPLSEFRRLIEWGSRNIKLAVVIGVPQAIPVLRRLLTADLMSAESTDLSALQSRLPARDCRVILDYNGAIAVLMKALATSSITADLMVLATYEQLIELLDALCSISEDSAPRSKLPDIAVFTGDGEIFNRAWYHNRHAYETLNSTATAVLAQNVTYFSHDLPPLASSLHMPAPISAGAFADGSIVAAHQNGYVRFLVNGFFAANQWTSSTVNLFRSFLSSSHSSGPSIHWSFPAPSFVVIQHGDHILHHGCSVGYGKRRGEAPAVRLIPDPLFFGSGGYQHIRQAIAEKRLPGWANREELVFWRGSATNNSLTCDGTLIERLEEVPRVAMCLALKDVPEADAAIMGPSELPFVSRDAAVDWLNHNGILRPSVPMVRHADYRFLIDIDGAASAWSFFEKLLLGSCVLKVESPFEQWFYREVVEWQHFVPIKHDLSDLIEKIGWCREHQEQAREIAEAGQKFAIGHTYELGRRIALCAIRDCSVAF